MFSSKPETGFSSSKLLRTSGWISPKEPIFLFRHCIVAALPSMKLELCVAFIFHLDKPRLVNRASTVDFISVKLAVECDDVPATWRCLSERHSVFMLIIMTSETSKIL